MWYSDPRVANLLLTWKGTIGQPRTAVVKAKDKKIRITADGEVLDARYNEGRLTVKLKPPRQPVSHVVIAGAKPVQQMISPSSATVTYDRTYGISFVHFAPTAATETLDIALEPSE